MGSRLKNPSCPGIASVCPQLPVRQAYLAILLVGRVSIFAMSLAPLINGPVAALERPVPLLGVQRLSTPLNSIGLTMLKRVEHLSPVTFRTSLEGRSARSVGWESLGLKRSVRVQAFIGFSS
jgi:hypothetical protein